MKQCSKNRDIKLLQLVLLYEYCNIHSIIPVDLVACMYIYIERDYTLCMYAYMSYSIYGSLFCIKLLVTKGTTM